MAAVRQGTAWLTWPVRAFLRRASIIVPIVARELRVAARRPATYRIRLFAALAAMALAGWKSFDLAWQGSSSSSQGASLFYVLSGLAFAYCLFIGSRVTADCVSEEKREGTLGLLFLTDLKGLDVVLGKLVASSLNSSYGILAVLPLLAMPLLLGGVTLVQFEHMVLVLLNAMFFSLSAGIFVSALSRNERKAMMGTLLLVLTPAALPFCIVFFMAAVLETIQGPNDFFRVLPWLMMNPIYPFVVSLPLPPFFLAIPPESFWFSLGAVHLVSWVLLFLTALILPRIWKDRVRKARTPRVWNLAQCWRLWTQGNCQQRSALRRRLLDANPYLWLVSRDRLKPAYAWLFLSSMIAVWLWGYVQHQDVMFDFYPLVPTLLMIHAFLKFWVVSEVSHRLVEDQRNGAFELLLSTPLTIGEILRGQRMALLRQFKRPILILGVLEILFFQNTLSLAAIVVGQVILIADLVTLMWVTMRLSLKARSINEVMLKSFLYVLAVPWVLYLVAWPIWQWLGTLFLRWTFGWYWQPEFLAKLFFWCAIGLLTDFFLVFCWARPQLLSHFRGTGLRQTQSRPQTWRRFLTWSLKTGF